LPKAVNSPDPKTLKPVNRQAGRAIRYPREAMLKNSVPFRKKIPTT